jgi:hypothetical protein
MSKPDFSTMSRSQLWHYVVEHRQDDEAFYALMDRAHESPGVIVESPEHFRQLIEERDRAASRMAEGDMSESA